MRLFYFTVNCHYNANTCPHNSEVVAVDYRNYRCDCAGFLCAFFEKKMNFIFIKTGNRVRQIRF